MCSSDLCVVPGEVVHLHVVEAVLGERWVEDVVAPGQRDPVGALGAAQGPTPQLSLLEDLGVAQRITCSSLPAAAADGRAKQTAEIETAISAAINKRFIIFCPFSASLRQFNGKSMERTLKTTGVHSFLSGFLKRG